MNLSKLDEWLILLAAVLDSAIDRTEMSILFRLSIMSVLIVHLANFILGLHELVEDFIRFVTLSFCRLKER